MGAEEPLRRNANMKHREVLDYLCISKDQYGDLLVSVCCSTSIFAKIVVSMANRSLIELP